MKRNIVVILLLFLYCSSFSQKRADIGIFVGRSYYLGDLNTNIHFKESKMALGAIYRHNFDYRWALRGSLIMGTLGCTDETSAYKYQLLRNADFQTAFYDFTAQMEFNFFPYKPGDAKMNNSPYVAAGFTFFMATDCPFPFQVAIPFGVGYKFNIAKKLSAGFEWTFRKSFTDLLDYTTGFDDIPVLGVDYPYQRGYIKNNDWYSMAGIFITYKLFGFGNPCQSEYNKY
ncbi:MAG: hypothetical protein A2W91_09015 [Bacteroidetes bacterium GWF2_38_335]|nr:MAG: hypothetical protein A2W91_09015 [Bacteroidetes bacterium GWF2_38_335]OFY80512.1 MAG: hypothetical protein A2281_08740 [Bacteroidetes bacterium RIFOXYA12_FULL_38_20]HBS85878.1 hypothetical protein [Bacteroidales bacterium]